VADQIDSKIPATSVRGPFPHSSTIARWNVIAETLNANSSASDWRTARRGPRGPRRRSWLPRREGLGVESAQASRSTRCGPLRPLRATPGRR
jgi:hypothetical protein